MCRALESYCLRMSTTASHPFITFNFDMRDLNQRTWLLLGETMSKCQHLAGSPLKPAAANELASVYLARGAQATTAIEGNTLSTDEVQKIVRDGSANLPESRQYLEREVQNVLTAITRIDTALRNGDRLPLTVDLLKELNFTVLDGIPDKPEVVPGEFRQHDVAVGGYKAPHWTEVPALVDQLVRWLEELRSSVTGESSDEDRLVNAVVCAILAHLYIAWIHPFGNGNGRTARLIEVLILSESGVVPLVATNLLSNYYNKTRNAYYLALDDAQTSVASFVKYAVLGLADELREQIGFVRAESERVHWESYVYEEFRRYPSTTARDRQRRLALALPEGKTVTPDDTIVLTTDLARRYAICGERTPARDLNDLVKMGLATKVGHRKYRGNQWIVKAFMPPVARS